MPLTRYRVRSEYGLADPELYRAADKDDPEALLEGVAMAGLVGVLRQLGDLAEFAAEIFHDLHEEVMATSARGHGLMVRVQQLEAEFPPIEKALLSQTNQSLCFYNAGVDWHPNLRSEQNLIARGDLPRFVMDSYEESRGPPRLFLLDKFDVAGAGACLKRYTDPSFFKVEAAASGIATVEMPRERKNRRMKQKKGLRWRNGDTTPEVGPTSHTKLHQLFLEERVENCRSDPARLVKLKKRHLNGSVIDSKTGKSYMEKFVETPTERELSSESSIIPISITSDYTSESGIRILEVSTVSPAEKSPRSQSACSSPIVREDVSKPLINGCHEEADDAEIIKVPDTPLNDETFERSSSFHKVQVEKQVAIYGEGKPKGFANGYESDDVTSEADNYMDALASVESEMDTDSEYRPNSTTRFLKAENHGTDSEANEEHLEHRAQLSDSQSVGNFSTSDDGNNSFKKHSSSFSYSDSPSSLVENTPSDSDGGAKVSPSTETCEAEIVGEPSNELSETAESLGATPHALIVSRDTCIEEENPAAQRDASSSELLSDLHSSPLHSDPGASLSEASLVGPKTDGALTEYIMPDSKVPDTVQNGRNLVDSIAVAPQVSSQINDDFTKTSQKYLVDEFEDEDPNAISNCVLHLSNITELASEKESRENSVNEGFQIQDELDHSSKSFLSDDNEKPSITQKQLCASPLPVLLPNNFPASCDHSAVVEPENSVADVDDSVTAIGVHTEVLSPTVDAAKSNFLEEVSTADSPQIPGLMEQRLPDFSEVVPHLEPVLAETDVLSSTEKPNTEVTSGTLDFEELGSSTSHEDAVGGNVGSQQHPSICLSNPRDANHANLDYMVPETAEVENAAIHPADFARWDDSVRNGICLPSDAVCSPSGSHKNVQEPLIGSLFPHEKEVELDEGVSPDSYVDSKIVGEPQHLEIASADMGVGTSISVSHDHSSLAICDDKEDLFPSGKTRNSLSVIDSSGNSASLDTREQEPESVPSYHLDNSEDAVTLPTSYQAEVEMTEKLLADQVGAECLVTDEAGPHPEFPLELSEVQADQLDAEHVEVDRASIYSSRLPSEIMDMGEERGEQIASQKCINQKVHTDASLASRKEDLPSQSSTSDFSSKSVDPEVDHVNQASNPFEPELPNIVLVPEASQVDLGELPPLPPLPPMQWRMGFGMGMGKFQHNSLEGHQGLCPSIQPSKADENAQVELPASQSGIHQPQNPFFPLVAREHEKSLHYVNPAVVNLAQPTTYSMHVPITVDANDQNNYATSGEQQSLNPFLMLPVISSERCGHDRLPVEGEIVQSSTSSFSATQPSQGLTIQNHDVPQMVTQPRNQPAPEAGLDATTHQQSLQYPEGEQGSPVVTSKPFPTKADGQVRLGLLMPEGEITWSSNDSGTLPDSEAGKPNGNPVNKLPRPRNPLIDAVNAHGKSKLRKVSERVRPQLGPKADERDSLLEQIRTKSFNLKPATVTRPSIPGPTPKTNLKVAAILEKANAIRQALAGSDDEDDEDNW